MLKLKGSEKQIVRAMIIHSTWIKEINGVISVAHAFVNSKMMPKAWVNEVIKSSKESLRIINNINSASLIIKGRKKHGGNELFKTASDNYNKK